MSREIKNQALSPEALKKVIETDYDPVSRRLLAVALDGTESDLDGLVASYFSAATVERCHRLVGVERHALETIVASGGRVRGENLRRELLLDGYGDTRDVLDGLVVKALVMTLANPGEPQLDLSRMMEHGTILQRDLAVGQPIMDALAAEAAQLQEESEQIDGVERVMSSSPEVLELNLLHLSMRYLHTPLKLNRDGSPHRRALSRLARDIVFPGASNEAGADVDVSEPEVFDYLIFLHALALQLGLLKVDGEYAETQLAGLDAFFTAPLSKRNRLMGDAFKGLRHWSEVDSFVASKVEEVSSSLTTASGEVLIGARGYVFSILRRARFSTWKLETAVESLCALMDPPFLHQSLKNALTEPAVWVQAFLRRGLFWLGAVERGVTPQGHVLRFSARGREMLGLSSEAPVKPSMKGMVVQPNFEIMVFLDATDASSLYRLYRVAERIRLSDRVGTFRLVPESVQHGYSLGEKAANVIAFLKENAAVEVPESVTFQLHDWERIHKRLVVYHDGFLVRHHDPDALDLWLGQVKHDTGATVVRLGPSTAYLSCNDEVLLKKLLTRANGLIVDIDAPAAMLEFAGPLLVTVDPIEADVVTMWELAHIGREVEDAPVRMRQFSLDVALMQKRWPEDTLGQVLNFLRPRTRNGLPASQQILLQSLLKGPPTAAIHPHITVIRLQDEATADLFGRVGEFRPYVIERLGTTAFSVRGNDVDELREKMIELGFKV